MSRHVRSDIAFSPVHTARRLRQGLWVTAEHREVTPEELDDRHLESLKAWLLENAAFYAAILLIHPDSPSPERRNGYWVRRTDRAILDLPKLSGHQGAAIHVVSNTKLMQDIYKVQDQRAEDRRMAALAPDKYVGTVVFDEAAPSVLRSAERNVRRSFFAGKNRTLPQPQRGGVDVQDPRASGIPLTLTLDNGEKIIVTGTTIETFSADGAASTKVYRDQ